MFCIIVSILQKYSQFLMNSFMQRFVEVVHLHFVVVVVVVFLPLPATAQKLLLWYSDCTKNTSFPDFILVFYLYQQFS